MRVLVAGVGYHNLSDLSLGPHAVSELQLEDWPDCVDVKDLSYGPIAVVHWLEGVSPPYERAVFVAAVDRRVDEARLTCYRWNQMLPDSDEIQARIREAVTGVVDLDNLLVITRHFGVLPSEVYVVELQPVVKEFGLEPSARVKALMPEVKKVARALAESPRGGPACVVTGLGGRTSMS